MKRLLRLCVFATLLPMPANADFFGNLVLEPEGCKQQEFCTLGEEFGFVDSKGKGWLAKKGSITDGASIPKWAQFFVGVPYRPEYVRAAVVHDYYSKSVRPVNNWWDTQNMFYEALLKSKVPEPRASVMYAAVLIGSGKWYKAKPGKSCSLGDDCIQTFNEETNEVSTWKYINESYGTPKFKRDFTEVKKLIEANGSMSLDDVRKLAISKRADAKDLLNTF